MGHSVCGDYTWCSARPRQDLIRRDLLTKRGLHLRQQGARLDRFLYRNSDRRSPSPRTSVV
jgi:hypothetical protein